MAIYVYVCNSCNDQFELNVPVAERDIQKHIKCGNVAERKMAFTGVVYAPTATNGGLK